MTGWNTETLAGTPGAGAITIVEGSSFCVSAANGDIVRAATRGVLPRHPPRLALDGAHRRKPVEPLAASTPEPFRAVFVGRAGHVPGRDDTLLLVERDRRVDTGCARRSRSATTRARRGPSVSRSGSRRTSPTLRGQGGPRRAWGRSARGQAAGRARTEPDAPGDGLGLAITATGGAASGDRLTFGVMLRRAWRVVAGGLASSPSPRRPRCRA